MQYQNLSPLPPTVQKYHKLRKGLLPTLQADTRGPTEMLGVLLLPVISYYLTLKNMSRHCVFSVTAVTADVWCNRVPELNELSWIRSFICFVAIALKIQNASPCPPLLSKHMTYSSNRFTLWSVLLISSYKVWYVSGELINSKYATGNT